MSPTELGVPFNIGPIKADPTRNMVYLVDATNSRLLGIDMTTGQQVYSAPIDDGGTSGELAVSIDDSKLYLSESDEDEIMVFSLPSLSPLPTLHVSFPPQSIASAVNGRLFADIADGSFPNGIVELNTSTGALLQTFGTTENYYYPPLLRVNFDGTNLYAGTQSISGFEDIYAYSLTGSQISAATGYEYNSENMIDFTPDEPNGRIYVMNGGIYGINVILTANDSYSTVWNLTGAYGEGVSFNSQSTVVFGESGDPYAGDIREFNRSNGAPLTDFVVGTDAWPIQERGIAATANGNVLYVRTQDGGGVTQSVLGLIGSLTQPVTLYPTITQTINFPSLGAQTVDGTFTLQATDSAGLPITYTVISGPATISGNVVTFTGAGTVMLAANQAGNSVDKAATQATISITVNLDPQTISAFNTIPTQTYDGPGFTFTGPTASSGLPVTLSVQSGPATLSGNSLTITGAGTIVLAADQAGNSRYAPAPEVTTSFVVNKASQTIANFSSIATKTFGNAPFKVTVPASSAGLPVSVSVQSGPATISGGTVTLTGAGTVVLAADQAGNANYNAAATVTTSFVVNSESQSISSFKGIGTRTYTPVPFTFTLPTATSGLPVTVTVVSGPATVSGNAITLTGVGKVELAANQGGSSGFAAAPQITTTFTVNKGAQTISAFQSIPVQTFGAAPLTIILPTATSGLPVTVAVKSGPAALSGNTVTLTGAGTVELSAAQAGNTDYNAATTVTKSFTVNKESQTLSSFGAIAPQSFGAAPFSITPPTASSGLAVTVTVGSGPAKISNNVVTLTGVGTVVLKAAQAGNTNFLAATTMQISFTVSKGAQTISAFNPIATQTFGEAPFTITPPVASSGLAVTVKVLSGPATFKSNKITLTGTGTVVLEANQAGTTDYNAAPEVTTSFVVN